MFRRCMPAFWPLLLMMHWTAQGQQIVGAQAGIIQYIEGNVFLDDTRLVMAHGALLEVSAGQHLWTSRGRVEVLLAPNIFVRLGEDSSLLMNRNVLNDTRIALENGSALLEVVQKAGENRIRMTLTKSVVEIKIAGVYRFDAGSRSVRVYHGQALITTATREATAKGGRTINLDNLASSKLDKKLIDSLHEWSARRSFYLFALNRESRKQNHWTRLGAGLACNRDFGVCCHSPSLQSVDEEQLWKRKQQDIEMWRRLPRID